MSATYVLEPSNLRGIFKYLKSLGWLVGHEEILSAERAGEGNMNCVLRVRTTGPSFILKQSRAWCEKFPHIPAPEERAVVEAAFYREVEREPSIASRMPRMLAFDQPARLLMLEDLGVASDFTGLYRGELLQAAELEALVRFAVDLHRGFQP